VKSLDTNVLFYATNLRSSGHDTARQLVERIAAEPEDWILADQVLFEYYRLVRNPAVLAKPLSAAEASRRLHFFRVELGCLHCAYEPRLFDELAALLRGPSFPAASTFDAVLAVTLHGNGVDTFFTRNVKDFERFGWFDVVDPAAA
jgi:predicted nucleic acid-binding protein